MDSNHFEIEVQETQIENFSGFQLPLNFLAVGEIENDDVKVYIKQNVYKALEKLASSDISKELGSIVLGGYTEELGKTHVIISDYIEAKYTDASASTLTFTHETWDYVYKEHERLYSDKKIVGWQHTHPNYGIFLSNYDMFIQENFFKMPFQVAYVIDPVQQLRGFFQWKNGKVEKLKGYYIYDDVGKPIKIEQKKIDNRPATSNTPSKVALAIMTILCVVCLALSVSLITLKNDYQEHLEKQEKIVSDINVLLGEQKNIIEHQMKQISTLQECLGKGLLDGSNKITVEDLVSKLESHEIELENQGAILSELKVLAGGSETENFVYFALYKVQDGDTLTSICAEKSIDYSSNVRIILAINGIEDANKIYEGQNLLLPVINAD